MVAASMAHGEWDLEKGILVDHEEWEDVVAVVHSEGVLLGRRTHSHIVQKRIKRGRKQMKQPVRSQLAVLKK
jgi:hypothetical protein